MSLFKEYIFTTDKQAHFTIKNCVFTCVIDYIRQSLPVTLLVTHLVLYDIQEVLDNTN